MAEEIRDLIFQMLEEPQARRVYINAPGEIYLEKQDSFELSNLKLAGTDQLESLLQGLGQTVGRQLSAAESAVHFRLRDGKRVAAFRPPGSTSPLVCISNEE